MKVFCEEDNCYFRAVNGECAHPSGEVHLDDYSNCKDVKYIRVCGDCTKFGTDECKWNMLQTATDPVGDCFVRREGK